MDKQKLNIKVSVYKNANDSNSAKTVNLLNWLQGYERYNHLVDEIRIEADKKRRSELKKQLPSITPSGIFKQRTETGLISHSGLICLDFDAVEPLQAKELLFNITNVLYAGLSASGNGIFALIPISNPKHHKAHFRALERQFNRLGLPVDKSCSNISRLRFYSYDSNPVLNYNAETYTNLYFEPKPKPVKSYPANDKYNNIEKLIRIIEAKQVDLTGNYETWFLIGCAIAEYFGEAGRNYFHRISQFYHNYSNDETDKQYDICLRRQPKGKGLGLLFNEAKTAGILLKEFELN